MRITREAVRHPDESLRLLHLELADADSGIAITNETFIYTRN